MSPKGWHSRHYLPHFDSQDVIQFVTFRLADSLPAEAIERLKMADRPETLRHELLDRGWGACWLRSDPIARLVENAFLEFDRFIRDERHFAAAEEYIDQNPAKAGLVADAALWPYGSARLKA